MELHEYAEHHGGGGAISPYGREDLLFQIAAQLEQAEPWMDRTPRFSMGRR